MMHPIEAEVILAAHAYVVAQAAAREKIGPAQVPPHPVYTRLHEAVAALPRFAGQPVLGVDPIHPGPNHEIRLRVAIDDIVFARQREWQSRILGTVDRRVLLTMLLDAVTECLGESARRYGEHPSETMLRAADQARRDNPMLVVVDEKLPPMTAAQVEAFWKWRAAAAESVRARRRPDDCPHCTPEEECVDHRH